MRSAAQQQGRSAVEEKEAVELFGVMFQCLQQQSLREVIAPRVQVYSYILTLVSIKCCAFCILASHTLVCVVCVQLMLERAHSNQLVLQVMQQQLANPRTTTPFAAVLIEHLVAHIDLLEGSARRTIKTTCSARL